jgi:hypothetical protein
MKIRHGKCMKMDKKELRKRREKWERNERKGRDDNAQRRKNIEIRISRKKA